MDAVKFLRSLKRMCNSYDDCDDCLLNGKCDCFSTSMDNDLISEFVEVAQEWEREHPSKTRAQDFFEKHPNAPKNSNGNPLPCAGHCGYCGDFNIKLGLHKKCVKFSHGCDYCWEQELEE